MTWVRRTEPPPAAHECAPPTHFEPIHYVADGSHGDLWRCDDCGRLWRNDAGRWERATWWQRLRHWGLGDPESSEGVPYLRRGQQVVSTADLPPRPTEAPPSPWPSGGCRHDR